MPLQKKKRMQLMKQCLQNYEVREITRIEKETQTVELSVSPQFHKKIEEMLNGETCDKKEHVPTVWYHTAAFRYTAIAIVAIFMILFPCGICAVPRDIVAGIPNFVLEPGQNIFDSINFKVNPYTLYKNELAGELPELEFGYIPDGFVVVEKELNEKKRELFLFYR